MKEIGDYDYRNVISDAGGDIDIEFSLNTETTPLGSRCVAPQAITSLSLSLSSAPLSSLSLCDECLKSSRSVCVFDPGRG